MTLTHGKPLSSLWRHAPFGFVPALLWLLVFLGAPFAALADTKTGSETEADAKRKQAKATAVALNYCRASFHRIRRYPSKRVLMEEQEKILNNLNLNGIADEEVIKLYAAVLQEISGVQIAERERKAIKERHRRVFYRQLSHTLLNLSTELATAHYASAVRTGAASWWDFRAMGWQTELDSWKVEKDRLNALTGKSLQFLDTFWKLTRKRDIPDRWLVRTTDLNRLEDAVREPDLAVRLRILMRMKNFMECYPPYWYYVGRTQQQMGQLFAAAETYQKLVEVGSGHFRKDEMLAAGLVNRAVIQQYLKQPSADKTARQALRFSTDVWEVNLLGADVLRRHKHFAEAEDAILRNLDVELERPQSLAALLALYYHWQQKEKLSERLASVDVIRNVPVPVLLQTARLLASDELPKPLIAHLNSSLIGSVDLRFGRDDLVFSAAGIWQLKAARMSLVLGKQSFAAPAQQNVRDRREVRFRRILELGSPLKPAEQDLHVSLLLDYPDAPRIAVHFERKGFSGSQPLQTNGRPRRPVVNQGHMFRMTSIDVGSQTLRLIRSSQPQPSAPPPPPKPPTSPNPTTGPPLSNRPSTATPRKPTSDGNGEDRSDEKKRSHPVVETLPPPPETPLP